MSVGFPGSKSNVKCVARLDGRASFTQVVQARMLEVILSEPVPVAIRFALGPSLANATIIFVSSADGLSPDGGREPQRAYI